MAKKYAEGEVLGKDKDGCLILWDVEHSARYNCGETLEQYGVDNLTPVEKKRVMRAPRHHK